MPDFRSLRRLLSARLASAARREDGYVIMVSIAMLAIALAIGGAALGETLSSRSHANRDARVKRALQAADAGVGAMLYQQNELPLKSLEFNGGPLGLGTLTDCLVPALDVNLKITGVAAAAADAAGVCPDSSGAGHPSSGSVSFPVGGHAYYQARFIPGATANGNHISLNPKIVSVGYDDAGNSSATSGYTVRRVEAILAPLDPFQAIEASGSLTFSGLKVLGLPLTATLNGNARANGSVSLPTLFLNPNLSGSLLGTVTYGPSPSTYTGPVIALANVKQATSTFTRSPISIASTKVSCPAADSTHLANCGDINGYSTATNSVLVTNGSAMTIPAGDYVFCNFSTNGTVTANSTATAPVRIFIDSPSSTRCSGKGGTQGNFTASQGLGNVLGSTLGATGASGLQIYVVGDQAAAPNTYDNNTTVTIGGGLNVIENYVVYAPTSKVNVSNCIVSFNILGAETDACQAIQGSIIGDDVTIKASAFTQDIDLGSYPLYSGLGAFHVQSYVECPPVYPIPSPDPTTGC